MMILKLLIVKSIIYGKVDGYIEENHRKKYLVFNSTDRKKRVLQKFTKHLDEINYLTEKINGG